MYFAHCGRTGSAGHCRDKQVLYCPADRNGRFYEGYYNETHFSVENVELVVVIKDRDNGDMRKTRFAGAILRCKDVCAPSLNIVLRGSGTDHRSERTDLAIFRQCFSSRTADNQPSDNLVTSELRELIRKIVSFSGKYTVPAQSFYEGEVIMAISGYSFGNGLPSEAESCRTLT